MDKRFSPLAMKFCPTVSLDTGRRATPTHISDVKVGDIILMQEIRNVRGTDQMTWTEKTVGAKDIKRGGFCGLTIFGDPFCGGRWPVPVVDYTPVKGERS